MRWTHLPVIAAAALAACGSPTQICLDDYDGDGICGAEDACPLDAMNDEDGDGVCFSQDRCALGNDADDEDKDDTPDACDVCLGDPLNDEDEDAMCDMVDPCLNDGANSCLREVTVGLQTDNWFDEATFSVTIGGEVLLEGTFTEPGAGLFQTFELPKNAGRFCVNLTDSRGDGGVRGAIWDENFGQPLEEWALYDWGDTISYCTDLRDVFRPERVMPERPWGPEDFLGGINRCDVYIHLRTENWGNETGWTLRDGRNGIVLNRNPGYYANYRDYSEFVRLYDGQFVMVMRDSYGDGWHGGWIELRLSPDGEAFLHGEMPTGVNTENLPFELICPTE